MTSPRNPSQQPGGRRSLGGGIAFSTGRPLSPSRLPPVALDVFRVLLAAPQAMRLLEALSDPKMLAVSLILGPHTRQDAELLRALGFPVVIYEDPDEGLATRIEG